jgi:MFS family permease
MRTTEGYLDRRWTALILLCVPQFVVVLDASIVNVALPSIGRGLHFSEQNLPWIVNAYVIASGGFLLLGGRAADLLGRRRVFMAGLLVVAGASLAAGFAATQGELIAARGAQGLGAAIISPAALSIVTTLFRDGAERNKALGARGAVAGSAGAVGVLLGGILTDSLGWEWVLWVNVPVSLIALALTPGLIAESRSELTTRHFDAAGVLTVTAGLSVLAYAMLDASSAGWGSTKIVALLGTAVILLGAFVATKHRSAAPLVPLRIFRLRTLTAQHRGASARRVAVLDVLLHLAVHAASPRLQPDPRGALIPPAGSHHRRGGRHGRSARDPARVQADPRRRDAAGLSGLVWFSRVSASGGSSVTSSARRCWWRWVSVSVLSPRRSRPYPESRSASRRWRAG